MVGRLMGIARQVIPWAAVGFVLGAAAGFQWGKKAKSNMGESVNTEFKDGVATVQFDVYGAARSGLADPINDLIDGLW